MTHDAAPAAVGRPYFIYARDYFVTQDAAAVVRKAHPEADVSLFTRYSDLLAALGGAPERPGLLLISPEAGHIGPPLTDLIARLKGALMVVSLDGASFDAMPFRVFTTGMPFTEMSLLSMLRDELMSLTGD